MSNNDEAESISVSLSVKTAGNTVFIRVCTLIYSGVESRVMQVRAIINDS
jgi:hypothetical protein